MITVRRVLPTAALGALLVSGYGLSRLIANPAEPAVLGAGSGLLADTVSLPDSGFLSGYDLATGKPVWIESPDNGLYYFVDPTCAACAVSYPSFSAWLNRTSDSAAIRFVSAERDRRKLLRYFSKQSTPFRTIGGASGSLLESVSK
jgi:hypothetical protein